MVHQKLHRFSPLFSLVFFAFVRFSAHVGSWSLRVLCVSVASS
ncbi:hypothetical protein HMPREF9440_01186 [Sutterella parvirubra YIT 11816]|uniref:Uncharacterized protein n=1 Tax=Sutterella parvirubra YIT 11816 TaxID=762967 RepID=H3KEM1_9BURK|nr:hypothetical protein HMPREF9440_01186 [Sutterella parvirubra YIT 11816]